MKRLAVVALLAGCRSAPAPTPQLPPPADTTAATVAHGNATAAPPLPPPPVADDAITVRVAPEPAFAEHTDEGVLVNCDLIVANRSPGTFELVELAVQAVDAAGAVVLERALNGNGVSPSIGSVPVRALPAGAEILVLNPLHTFPRDLAPARLRFTLTFARRDTPQSLVAHAEVALAEAPAVPRLELPLRGRVLAWDGHDFLAHHRRWDYLDPRLRELAVPLTNPARYSYDFVPVDAAGAQRTGDPAVNASWVGFGAAVVAPAAGRVVSVVDREPDNREFDIAALPQDALVMYGNRIVIEHGPRTFSMLAHLQQGSAKVKAGDRVKAGQVIASVGASGSSLMPHLHYQLQTSPTAEAEGVPAYFHDFVRVRGAARLPIARGHVATGEVVERK